jgi:hypothetical protein
VPRCSRLRMSPHPGRPTGMNQQRWYISTDFGTCTHTWRARCPILVLSPSLHHPQSLLMQALAIGEAIAIHWKIDAFFLLFQLQVCRIFMVLEFLMCYYKFSAARKFRRFKHLVLLPLRFFSILCLMASPSSRTSM